MADSPDLPPISPDPAVPRAGAGPGEVAPGPVTPPPAPKPRSGLGAGLHTLWTLVVRLIILGAGVSLGWLAGLLVAQVWPSSNPEPPLTEVALRYGSQTQRKLRQLPFWWQNNVPFADDSASPAVVVLESSETAVPEVAAELPPLTDDERDDIQADLTSLQQDLASVTARLTELETTLGAAPGGTVEERLQQLNQRLSPEAAIADAPEADAPETSAPETDDTAGAAPAAPPTTTRVPYPEPRFALVSDRIVLPSALLFEPGSSTLTAPGQQLLDSIAPDLARYGAATLLVGSHTDGTANPDQASQITLQQAVAVEQYLVPQLEGSGIRWVSVGYGQTRPSTGGTTPGDQQRNQRIEIGIVPRN